MKKALLTTVVLSSLFVVLAISANGDEKAYNGDEPRVYDPAEMVAKRIRETLAKSDEKLRKLAEDAAQIEKPKPPVGKKAKTPEQQRAAFWASAKVNLVWLETYGVPTSDPRLLAFGGRSPAEIAGFTDASRAFTALTNEAKEIVEQKDLAKFKVKITEMTAVYERGKKVWLAELKNPDTTRPAGPIILGPARLLGPFHRNGVAPKVYYHGQPAQKGAIDLIPSSGFFKGFSPEGPLPAFPDEPNGYVRGAFQYLTKSPLDPQANDEQKAAKAVEIETVKKLFQARGSSQKDIDDLDEPNGALLRIARWHLYCPKPGEIKVSVYMKVTAEQAKEPWIIDMAEGDQIEDKGMTKLEVESRKLHLQESDGKKPQTETLTFNVKKPGRVSFYLNADKMPKASGSLAFLRLQGPAIDDASLLRVRFRPLALHMRFFAPKECPNPQMWVVESKPVGGCNAFSPLTTPFGYYGFNFNDTYVHPGGALHWSMWGGPKVDKDGSVDMAYAPRILASNNPKAKGQVSFAEGTTVRGMNLFYTTPARSVIQAFRITKETDGARTYYGYLFDEQRQSWRVYTVGQMGAWKGRLFKDGGEEQVALGVSSTGSFVEVPGPFGVEMSGDIERKMARRVWFYGSDGKFYPIRLGGEKEAVDENDPGKKPDAKPDDDKDAPDSPPGVRNQVSFKTADGWIINIMGGMANYKTDGVTGEKNKAKDLLPAYLQADKAKGLFELPVKFGDKKASAVKSTEATIDYQIVATGPNSKGTLYYGTQDYNAHIAAPDAAKLGSFSHGWRSSTPPQKVEAGRNQFQLKDLTSATTYHFRLYVEHDDGRSWDYVSGRFQTAGK